MSKSDPERILDTLDVVYQLKGNRLSFLCPFHHDTDPSAAFYLDTEKAYCFTCGYSLRPIEFYARFKEISREEAAVQLGRKIGFLENKPDPYDRLFESEIRRKADLVLERIKGVIEPLRTSALEEKIEEILWKYRHRQLDKRSVDKSYQNWYNRVEDWLGDQDATIL